MSQEHDMTEKTAEFTAWLKNCLSQFSRDIDADAFGDYIHGILEDETMTRDDHLESVEDFLSSVLVVFYIFGFSLIAGF